MTALDHAFPNVARKAFLSPCETYRYTLSRLWATNKPRLAVVMFNPSTADARADDPTIRTLMRIALFRGFGAIHVVNLFAYRCTDPKLLRLDSTHSDIIGPANDEHIATMCRGRAVLCAWGANADDWPDRARDVTNLIRDSKPSRLYALGFTKSRQPKHPLYQKIETPWIECV